jgi:uncharacterized protein YycO
MNSLTSYVRTILLNASIPIQKIMQKMHPPEAQTTVEMAQIALQYMRSGDCLCSREVWRFTSLFIPGFWTHSAVFGFVNDQPSVIEAIGEGVRIVPWLDWVIEMNNWCVLRPTGTTEHQGQETFRYAQTKIGEPYNYMFSPKARGFWCSGLTYWCWSMTGRWGGDVFTRRLTWGEWVVTPDDFYEASKKGKLEVILEYRDII